MMQDVRSRRERMYLVGVQLPGQSATQLRDEMSELRELAGTAGALVVGEEVQRRTEIDPATFIGKGKLRDLEAQRYELELDLVCFNEDLSPRQQRNLEKAMQVTVIDRTELILDIFAQHARTREGRIQVESAQLHHLLPRLIGGRDLSRLGGGIGTRGPGEQKLEVDRRRIRRRVSDLGRELSDIRQHRGQQRERRDRSALPVIAITGYTNSGKSTLLNALTEAGVRAEDRLFATLDPTTRRVRLGTREALLTDTVGFIQKLPTDLVAAFRSTLEEVRYADVILHVVDISDPRFMSRMRAVEDVLRELGVSDQPVLGAYNKVDLVDRDELAFRLAEARERTAGVPISALARIGLGALVDRLEPLAAGRTVHVKLLIPYSASALVARFHEVASDRRIRYAEDGVHATGMVPQRELGVFRQYEARLGSRDGRGADSST